MNHCDAFQAIVTIEKLKNYMNLYFTAFDTEPMVNVLQNVRNSLVGLDRPKIYIEDVPTDEEFVNLLIEFLPDVIYWCNKQIAYDYSQLINKSFECMAIIAW